MRIGDLKV